MIPPPWKEPAAILQAVGALIALAVGFGLDVTGEQVALIMAAVTAVLGLVIRQVVVPAGNAVMLRRQLREVEARDRG